MPDNQEEIKTPEMATESQTPSVEIPVVEQIADIEDTLENETNANLKPYMEKEFNLYKIWRRLPTTIRGQKEKTLILLGFDKALVPLLQIRTQKDFAKKFKVAETTIVSWNNHLEANPEKNEERFAWAKDLTKNLIFALYKNGLADGDASKVKLFLQYIENFEEKTGVKVEDTRETTLLRNELNSVLNQIAEPEGGENASIEQTTDDGNSEASNIELANEDPQA